MMKHPGVNPYLPLWEYVSDGEPHVFDGRVYVYGSHDRFNGHVFCPNDYVGWSAPIDDLSDWRYEGVLYRRGDDPLNPEGKYCLYAPDVALGTDGLYYLYYVLDGIDRIGVAVSQSPAGPFQYYGAVQYEDGTPLGARPEDELPYDPAVYVEGDDVWLYMGFCLPVNPGTNGCCAVRLQPDMYTVAESPATVIPSARYSQGTSFEGHAFFEAASLRKVGERYVLIYSAEHGDELCYATALHPEGPFSYGGVILSNADRGLPDYPAAFASTNHGSIEKIAGMWYVFYHRSTNGSLYCRQGCLEPISVAEDGSIRQVEMTSCGPNGGPLPAEGEYPAAIACNLFLRAVPSEDNSGCSPYPRITQEDPDADPARARDTSFLENLREGSVVGFKYFDCHGVSQIAALCCGKCFGGTLEVCLTPDGEPVGTIPLKTANDWTWNTAAVSLPDGVHPLYLRVKGYGAVCLSRIRFICSEIGREKPARTK